MLNSRGLRQSPCRMLRPTGINGVPNSGVIIENNNKNINKNNNINNNND